MSKVNKKGRSKNNERFVQLMRWQTDCPAYRLLTPAARSLYVELKSIYAGNNNGDLFMSERMAAVAIGVGSPNTSRKALRELQDKGFIRVRRRGSFGQKHGLASTFILTEYAYRSQPPSKDFMRYKLTEDEKKRLPKVTPTWNNSASRAAKTAPGHWPDEGSL